MEDTRKKRLSWNRGFAEPKTPNTAAGPQRSQLPGAKHLHSFPLRPVSDLYTYIALPERGIKKVNTTTKCNDLECSNAF